ncbi:MAG: SGNH/GDSL hydrolase family protein [Desulfobaccales bacterium]
MRRFLTPALVAAAAFVLALALGEAALGLLRIEYPDFYDYDPVLGSRLRPGIRGYWLKEGKGYVSINSDGLRDREHSLSPPPNTLRIAVLGDSFAEAMQVNQEEAFWAVMEKDLQRCGRLGGRQVEVLNLGQSGFGTALELLAWRHRARKYAPDIVLLAFFTGNDVADNSPAFMQFSYHPYFTLENGKLTLHDQQARENWEAKIQKFGRKFYQWRHDNFRTYQLFREGLEGLNAWIATLSPKGKAVPAPGASEAGIPDNIYRPPISQVWQEAWKVTEALLRLLRDEVAAAGARFYLVVLTNGPQVHPDPKVRAAFAQSLGIEDLFYPDRRLENFCRQEGIPVLLLAPVFQAEATRQKVFFHGFADNLGRGHWNRDGHRLAGQLLARWLCGQLN